MLAPEEQLTPAILYIGVATLTGSVLARGRSLPIRFLLPPTLLVASSHHFLPKTTTNVSDYFGSLEDTYLPTVAEKHRIANAHTAMTWERIKDTTQNTREMFSERVASLVGEAVIGLKLRETLGWWTAQAEVRAKVLAKEVLQSAEESALGTKLVFQMAEEAKGVVEDKAKEVKNIA